MANSVVFPRAQFFSNSGRPLVGGRIHTYVAGSSTRARTYQDAANVQINTNPIILDARGEAAIYLAEGVEYKFVVEDSTGALIMTQEPVYGAIWPNASEWPSDTTLSYQYMTEARAAASATGPIKFFDTKAQADAAIGTMANGDIIEVSQDETRAGARTRYKVQAGALVFVVNLDQTKLDLAAATGASLVGFQQEGTGAVSTTVQSKLRESVSVKDFGAVGDGVADDTAAFVAAQTASKIIYAPPGTYLVDNLRIQTNRKIIGAGYEATILKQKTASNYAVNCLSDVTTGQLLGVAIQSLGFEGATGATVATLNVEANGVYVVTHSNFDFTARNTYSPLRMHCPDAANVYNCTFKVTSSASSTGITSQGAYNNYDFFITNVTDSFYVYDISSGSVFHKVVTEGSSRFSGQDNVIVYYMTENYPNPSNALNTALRIDGNRQNFKNISIITVPSAKAQSGIEVYSSRVSIETLSIIGVATTTTPTYPMFLGVESSGVISNVISSCPNKLDSYTQGFILRRWSFSGDLSQLLLSPTARNSVNTRIVDFATSGETLTFGPNSTVTDWFDVLVLDNAATLAALAVTLPTAPVNGQTARISASRNGVTALTLTPASGHSVVGTPTTLSANSSVALVFNSSNTSWYRLE